MMKYTNQLFDDPTPTGYDNQQYCTISDAQAYTHGKYVKLAIWDSTGANLLAVAGQKDMTINRSADTTEVNSKDTEGGWKSYTQGMKEWSIDLDTIYIPSDDSNKALAEAFETGDPVCCKVYDFKHNKGLFGGLAVVTSYNVEAPTDDALTGSITLQGVGALIDFSTATINPDTKPE